MSIIQSSKFRVQSSIVLSVVYATYNEQANIFRSITSVKGLADEVIVVDGSSTDKTREIARQLGAKVYKTANKPMFHINKQLALDKARGRWILQLDADEVVTPELRKEIKTILEPRTSNIELREKKEFGKIQIKKVQGSKFKVQSSDFAGYYIPRLNYFLGKPLRKGGQYPDYVIRLFRKGKARFPCISVHEQIEIGGTVGYLQNPLHHFTTPSVEKYWINANRYTSLTAKDMKDQNIKPNFINLLRYTVVKPIYTFGLIYIRHKGFLDGSRGLLFALFSALHSPIAYFKYWELINKPHH